MPKFFSDRSWSGHEHIELRGQDCHHIKDVLRLKRGDKITVCDADGTDFELELETLQNDLILARVLSAEPSQSEAAYQIVFCQALPKSDKMDIIVRQAVELGASVIIPFRSDHSQIRLEAARAVKKQERWQAIAEAAAKQCGRAIIPEVRAIADFETCAEQLKSLDFAFIPWEGERSLKLGVALKAYTETLPKSIGFAIGPEGGFSAREMEIAHAAGIQTVTLGPRILRTETAGAAVLAGISTVLE